MEEYMQSLILVNEWQMMVDDAAFLLKPHLTTQFGLVENNFQLPPIKS